MKNEIGTLENRKITFTNYLGSHPIWCSNKRSSFPKRSSNLGRDSKIGQLDVTVISQKNVGTLFRNASLDYQMKNRCIKFWKQDTHFYISVHFSA